MRFRTPAMYFGIILWNYVADFPFVSWSYTNLPKCFLHPDWTEFQLSKEKYGSPERPRHLQLSGSGGSIYYAREKSGEEGSGARFPLPPVHRSPLLGWSRTCIARDRPSYDGRAVRTGGFRLTRITLSNSSLSAGFWKYAAAPALNAFSSLPCGSRALSTMTGTPERALLFCSRSRTTKPSPAGRPRSSTTRSGRSFCAVAIAA